MPQLISSQYLKLIGKLFMFPLIFLVCTFSNYPTTTEVFEASKQCYLFLRRIDVSLDAKKGLSLRLRVCFYKVAQRATPSESNSISQLFEFPTL